MIRSPLRYPGGKSRAIKQIAKYLPKSFLEYREPLVGGGSVFFHIKQTLPNIQYWINDLNEDLYCFWKVAQSNLQQLVEEIEYRRDTYVDGKALFEELTSNDINFEGLTSDERAVRFFILNRITFSGTVEAGGFSKEAFEKRFTYSSIERLADLKKVLPDVRITNFDYSVLLEEPGQDVFIFLDPPYLGATKSRLYGKRGNLHTSFDHQRFSKLMRKCSHKWMITYDDSEEIVQSFKDFAYIYKWELQYGMNNYKQDKAAKGKELIITNYEVNLDLDSPTPRQLSLNLFP
ncbi:MAG: DNA adenine methylase [Coleofasciculus sp. S288]|nr:DNA adenine methylase [Coleofasciculus sp. S288]